MWFESDYTPHRAFDRARQECYLVPHYPEISLLEDPRKLWESRPRQSLLASVRYADFNLQEYHGTSPDGTLGLARLRTLCRICWLVNYHMT